MSQPLVTFALFAYKQARFIREAVEGALAQTYSPLEIILSDDCSPDQTFAIMQEMAAAYQGPHAIILNRNPMNLGLAGHINRVMDMAQGELIVMAAGDDISLPERTEHLTREWVAQGQPSGIASSAIIVDATNSKLAECPATGHYTVTEINQADQKTLLSFLAVDPGFVILGCAAAWSQNMWKTFGRLADYVSNEDTAFTFRSCFLRGVRILDVPLVRYRHHNSNIWSQVSPHILITPHDYLFSEDTVIRRAIAHLNLDMAMQGDLELAISMGLATQSQAAQIRAAMGIRRHKALMTANWWELSLPRKLSLIGKLDDRTAIKLLKLLPDKSTYVAFRSLAARIKKLIYRNP